MIRTRRHRPLLAATLAVAALAAACGGVPRNDGGAVGTTGPTAPGETAPPGGSAAPDTGELGTTTAPAATATPGGKIVYGLEADNASGFCLPEAQLAISGIQVARAVYDTLTVPNEQGEYEPFLAQAVTPNADYTEWTIVLRDGVTFHDGSPLDATVVKNNIDAFRGQYPARAGLLFIFVLADIADITVIDPLILKVTTKRPWVTFPAYLYSSGRLGISGQAQLDNQATCNTKLIGTGPFMSPDTIGNTADITLVKNPTYWLKDADGNQLPYLDKIEFRALPEESQRLSSLQSGQIDAFHTAQGNTLAQLQQDNSAVITTSENNTEVAYMLLNSSIPPFDNQAAREAVALAFDFDTYNNLNHAGMLSRQASGPFAPGVLGYLDDTGFPTFDLDAAKAKVAEYKQQTGQDLVFGLTNTNDAGSVAEAQIVQTMMQDAGIKVDIAPTDQSTQINDAIGGKLQAFMWRNHPGGDPDEQYVWWYSEQITNFGKIADPELDALLDTGRTNADPAVRQQAYEDLNRLMAAKVYNVWAYWVLWTVATHPRVQGLFGPQLPSGSAPAQSLVLGHSVAGLWVTG